MLFFNARKLDNYILIEHRSRCIVSLFLLFPLFPATISNRYYASHGRQSREMKSDE